MTRVRWGAKLLAILGVGLVAAAAAAALPDNPYQRWQLIEDTLFANATWSYERIHFDPRPIDVAILGASRFQMGLSAPVIAAQLKARGLPLAVANLSVVEDGRNMEWAVADELFKAKRPKVLVVMAEEKVGLYGHPGFKYVAPAGALAAPPSALLHNAPEDLLYLPYRQLMLFGARLAPGLFGLRDRFDPTRFAAKPDDYSVSRVLADGKLIDMDRDVPAEELDAGAREYAEQHRDSRLPAGVRRLTEVDDPLYVEAIARLAAAHGARLVFVYLPLFRGGATVGGQAFYARYGRIENYGDLATDPALFQSFAHLNHRGAVIASERVAAAVADMVRPAPPAAASATGA